MDTTRKQNGQTDTVLSRYYGWWFANDGSQRENKKGNFERVQPDLHYNCFSTKKASKMSAEQVSSFFSQTKHVIYNQARELVRATLTSNSFYGPLVL